MIYLSGPLAFGVPCSLNTEIEWRFGRSDWTDENMSKCMRESDNSILGTYGIEENVFIERKPLHTYNVANHIRAYLDMLLEGRYEELRGMFDCYIKVGIYRRDMFEVIIHKMLHLDTYKDINNFLYEEFGSAWVSWNETVVNQAKRMRKLVGSNPEQIPPEDMKDIFESLRNTEQKLFESDYKSVIGGSNK